MRNNPDEWHVPFSADFAGVNPTYPTDGRETVFEPYEAYCDTRTAEGYLAALERLHGRDGELPLDFGLYLAQRVPSAAHLTTIPGGTPIDAYGAGPR